VNVDGRVVVRAERRSSHTVLSRLECAGVLAARSTPWGLYLVAAGASPVGVDRLEVDLELGEGAELEVRTLGATLARRGSRAGASRATTRAVVRDGAALAYLPEPGIACVGARHRCEAVIDVAPTARLCWRDEVVLGRHGERVPGSWWSALSIARGSRPLLASELGLGPAAPLWQSPVALDGARAVSSVVLVAPELDARPATSEVPGARGGRFPLAGPGVEVIALGESLAACRAVVDSLLAPLSTSDCLVEQARTVIAGARLRRA